MMKTKMRVMYIFEHLCVVIDVLAGDMWVEKVVEILFGEFDINVRADVIIGVVCDIGVEMLTGDANANVLVAAINALGFAMPAP